MQLNASVLAGTVAGVRYAWPSVPHGEVLYDGGGDAPDLPAAPFLARCGTADGVCDLVKGGSVPVGLPED